MLEDDYDSSDSELFPKDMILGKARRDRSSKDKAMKILTCGHDDKPYHAKGLCKNCYQK